MARKNRSAWTLRDRHLLWICLGAGASLLLPEPHWGIAALLLLLAACRRDALSVAAFLLGVGSGAINGTLWLKTQLPEHCLRREVQMIGRVTTLPREQLIRPGHVHISARLQVIAIDDADCAGPKQLLVSQYLDVAQRDQALRYNTEVAGLWRLKPLTSQVNPGGYPDQARWASQGVDGAATAVGPLSSTRLDNPIAGLRSRIIARLAGRSGEGWAAMRALVLGDSRALDSQLWQDLRHLGIVHVLVISGLHIGLLASICLSCFCLPRRFLQVPGDQGGIRYACAGTLLVTGAYVLLVGASLPVVRAYLMLIAAQVPLMLGWSVSGRRCLLLALTALLLWDPRALLGASFWLSAAATWLLVNALWQPAGVGRLFWLQMKMVWLMAPVTLFWFSEMSFLGLMTNLVVVPVVTFVMLPAGLMGLVLSDIAPVLSDQFWWLGQQSWALLQWPLQRVLDCCRQWAVLQAPLGWTGLGLGVLAIALWGRSRSWALLAFAGAAIGAANIKTSSPEFAVTLLDVGQGLSAVIQAGNRTLVYDTGDGQPGGFSQAEKVLVPYLDRSGVERIDVLLVSHADRDHSGGHAFLTNTLPIERALGFGGAPCRNGERWRWGSMELMTLNGPGQGEQDRNDGSCGLLVTAPNFSLLIPGDVSARREREWVRYWRDELSASVLVLAHHGSRTSTSHALLKWVRPDWALISAGRGNAFGHPHREVTDRVRQKAPVTVLDTAKEGAISITSAAQQGLQFRRERTAWSPYWLKLP